MMLLGKYPPHTYRYLGPFGGVLDVKPCASLYQQTRGGRMGHKSRDVQCRLVLLDVDFKALPTLFIVRLWVRALQ